jgi:hypothetical protein
VPTNDSLDTPDDDELVADALLDESAEAADEARSVPALEPVSDPVGTARRKHGAAGAMLAAGMFGVDIALGRKPKEEAPVVITASGEPGNIDSDGIEIPIDEATSVFAPPQPPVDPFPPRRKRR